MKVRVLGLAVWARGLESYTDLRSAIQAGCVPADAEFSAPKPEAIPARERRRAGLMINLAVTVAHQACEHAGVDKSAVASVFVSSMGDTDITDYMCRKLTLPEKLLSPTKFHNSVHNAPSGYWTISAENRAPSTFVGGYDHSVGAGLLEAVSQVQASEQPVLLVAYDIANHPPFTGVSPIEESFGGAFVLAPQQWPTEDAGLALELDVQLEPITHSEPMSLSSELMNADLASLAAGNPSAASLVLMQHLVRVQEGLAPHADVTLSAAEQLGLKLRIQSATS